MPQATTNPLDATIPGSDLSTGGQRLVLAILAAMALTWATWLGSSLASTDPPAATAAAEPAVDGALSADEEHEKLFLENRFPSATTCATCHPDHYREWSVSPHAYAQMSPVFNAMHGTILQLTNGTNGDFCIRCHTPVGMNLGEPEFMSNIDRHPTSREGVTCIVCHRVNKAYGKLSGRLAIVEGDLFEPVYGPQGNDELERVLDSGDYRVNTERGRAGRAIHTRADKFFQLSTSGFCGTCHDVNLGQRLPARGGLQRVQELPLGGAGNLVPGLSHGDRARGRLGLP